MQDLPKHSPEIEKSMLAILMTCTDDILFDSYIEQIKEDYFYLSIHRKIFNIIKIKKIRDIVLIVDEIIKSKIDINPVYISDIVGSIYSTYNFDYYLDELRKKYQLRQLRVLLQEVESYIEKENDISTIIDHIENYSEDIRKQHITNEIKDFRTKMMDWQDKITNYRNGKISILSSGFPQWDDYIQGFGTEYIIIAAATSMGKTAFALQLMLNMADAGKQIIFFSSEMTDYSLIGRIMSYRTNIEGWKFRDVSRMNNRDFDILTSHAMKDYNDFGLWIDDTSNIAIEEIYEKTTNLNMRLKKKNKKIDAIFIDYIQLLTTKEKTLNTNDKTEKISRKLLQLTKKFDCPVFAMSQLNRSVSYRQDKRPSNSDLRDSGALEQDAHIIMTLYRDDYYNKKEDETNPDDKSTVEVAITKGRDSCPLGIYLFRWEKNFNRYRFWRKA